MLSGLDRSALDLLGERTAGPQLTARRELDVDLAVGGVLDVFLEVELQDRIAARGAENIGRRDGHDVLGRFFGTLNHG